MKSFFTIKIINNHIVTHPPHTQAARLMGRAMIAAALTPLKILLKAVAGTTRNQTARLGMCKKLALGYAGGKPNPLNPPCQGDFPLNNPLCQGDFPLNNPPCQGDFPLHSPLTRGARGVRNDKYWVFAQSLSQVKTKRRIGGSCTASFTGITGHGKTPSSTLTATLSRFLAATLFALLFIAQPTNAQMPVADPDIIPSVTTLTATEAVAITPITITNNGGAVPATGAYSINPLIANGLSFDTDTGEISGTPANPASAQTYTITATNTNGTDIARVIITVNAVPIIVANPSTLIANVGTAITPTTIMSTGGPVTSYFIALFGDQSLNAATGLDFDSDTGSISGTPTMTTTGALTYGIFATNAPSVAGTSVVITILAAPAPDISPSVTALIATQAVAITPITIINNGGAVPATGAYSISPLIANGLSFNTDTGEISGTPMAVAGEETYTITATNATGSHSASVTITVNPVPIIAADPHTLIATVGTAITPTSITNMGGPVTSYAISRANGQSLEANTGLVFDPSTGSISGTPTMAADRLFYTISATNAPGFAHSASIDITIVAAPDISPSVPTLTATVGTAIPPITINASAGGAVARDSYSISPDLPAGLSIDTTTGEISGMPTVVAGEETYTITANGVGIPTVTATATVNITVNAADNTAPDAPVITQPTTPTNDDSITISGSAEADATVTLSQNGTALTTTATAGSNGDWSIEVTLSADNNGANTFTATATDRASNASGSSNEVTVTLDQTKPTIAIRNTSLTSPTNDNPIPINLLFSEPLTGFEASDITVHGGTITAGSYQILSAVADGRTVNVTFTITPSADGPVEVGVAANVATDAAGNDNANAGFIVITYDGTAPDVAITSTAQTVNTAAFTLTGTTEAGATVDVLKAGASIGAATVTATDWTFATMLTEGTNLFTVTASDAAGNTSTAAVTITRAAAPSDTTRPSVAISSFPVIANIVNGDTVNATTLRYEALFDESVGGFEIGDITVTGTAGVTMASGLTGAGRFRQFEVLRGNLDGTVIVSIAENIAEDAAGNGNTASDEYTLTIDTTPPVITRNGDAALTIIVGDTYTDAGAVASDNIAGTITGSITTSFTLDDTVVTSLNSSQLGTYIITYNVSDAAGISAMAVTRMVTVVEALSASSVIATAAGDKIRLSFIDQQLTNNGATPGDFTLSGAGAITVTELAVDAADDAALILTLSGNIAKDAAVTLAYTRATGSISGVSTSTNRNGIVTTFAATDVDTSNIVAEAVVAAPNISITPATVTATAGTAIADITIDSSGGAVVSYSIEPIIGNGIGNGLLFNTTTGTISGTPTAAANAIIYTITATNSGGTDTAMVNITVNAAVVAPDLPDISVSPTSLNAIVGIAINPFVITNNGGTATYSISPDLPAGLSIDTATGTISGTPTAISGSIPYYITATNAAGSDTATIFGLSVQQGVIAPNISVSPSSLTFTVGIAVTTNPITITNSGGLTSTGFVLTGANGKTLTENTGLSYNFSGKVISGTPTKAASAEIYTIRASNPRGSSEATITITVNEAAPSISISPNTVAATVGTAISDIAIDASAGGTVVSYSIEPVIGNGLLFNTTTGTISGTPTAAANAIIYTITATNSGGTDTAMVNITVNAALTAPSISASVTALTATEAVAITPITINASAGGAVPATGAYSIMPAIANGLSFDTDTGTISGTPVSSASAQTYTITATNTAGSDSTSVTITVNPVPIIAANPGTLFATVGTAIIPTTIMRTGGPVTSYGIILASSQTLNAATGLNFDPSTGSISGTPTMTTNPLTYGIFATNAPDVAATSVVITIVDAPDISTDPSALIATVGTAISPITIVHNGGAVVSYSISPALPAGLSIDTATGRISGTPTIAASMQTYTITANGIGIPTVTDTASVEITVNAAAIAAPSISISAATVTATVGSAISDITIDARAGGDVASYSINPVIGNGLLFNTTTGTISGTPMTAAEAIPYTITATNSGGMDTATVTITVEAPDPSLPNPLVCMRHPAVQQGIIAAVSGKSACGDITAADLAAITALVHTGGFHSGFGQAPPKGSDFAGLTALTTLGIIDNKAAGGLTTLPADLFQGLPALRSLSLNNNQLRTLPIGIFSGLSLEHLTLTGNPWVSLPTNILNEMAFVQNAVRTAITNVGGTNAALPVTNGDIPAQSLARTAAPLTLEVATFFSDPDDTLTYTATSAAPAIASVAISGSTLTITPVALGTTNIMVTARDTAGQPVTQAFAVTVGGDAVPVTAPNISISPNAVTATVGTAIADITIDSTTGGGGDVDSYSIDPNLPAGLLFSTTTGTISGTPTAVAEAISYIITATNSGGTDTASVTITVNNVAPRIRISPATLVANMGSPIMPITIIRIGGGAVVSYGIMPDIGNGLMFDTGTISGTPDAVADAITYTITATNSGGTDTAMVTITVNAPDTTRPSVAISSFPESANIANGDTVNATTLQYEVIFSERISGFEIGEIRVTGTAGVTTASNLSGGVNGTGRFFRFDVLKGNLDGTVIVSIAENIAEDAASNGNTASGDYTLTIDTTPPTITLLGSATLTIVRGTDYTDAGATASDNIAGTITGSITTSFTLNGAAVAFLNSSLPGTYIITYNVSDAAGISAMAVTRMVTTVEALSPNPDGVIATAAGDKIRLQFVDQRLTNNGAAPGDFSLSGATGITVTELAVDAEDSTVLILSLSGNIAKDAAVTLAYTRMAGSISGVFSTDSISSNGMVIDFTATAVNTGSIVAPDTGSVTDTPVILPVNPVTHLSSVLIVGTAESGATISVSVKAPGATAFTAFPMLNATVPDTGSWVIFGIELAHGTNTIRVTAQSAGKTVSEYSNELNIAFGPPVITVDATAMNVAHDVAAVTLTGTVTANGGTVTVAVAYADGTSANVTSGVVDGAGAIWSINTPLKAGTNTIVVSIRAQGVSGDSPVTLTITRAAAPLDTTPTTTPTAKATESVTVSEKTIEVGGSSITVESRTIQVEVTTGVGEATTITRFSAREALKAVLETIANKAVAMGGIDLIDESSIDSTITPTLVVNTVVDITVNEGACPAKGCEVTLSYEVSDEQAGKDLYVFHYDEMADTWEALPHVRRDRTELTVTALADSFSPFALFNASAVPTTPVAVPSISISPNTLVATVGTAIQQISIVSSGGAVESYSIAPAIGNGLSFSTATGTISGTPTAVARLTTYTITATNATGSAVSTVAITVNASGADKLAKQLQADNKQLNKDILPNLVQTMLASTMAAVSNRMDAAFSGTPQAASYQFDGQTVQLDSRTPLSVNLHNTVEQKLPTYIKALKDDTLDWKRLIGNSSFVMPLNALDEDGGAGATVWGSGEYINLSDKDWKGDVFSLQLGVDQRIKDDLLAGGLVSWSKGDVDYTLDGERGKYTHRVTSIHPYMARSRDGVNLWGSIGYGQGELSIAKKAKQGTNIKRSSGTRLLSLSAGISGRLTQYGQSGLKLKSDMTLAQVDIDGSTDIPADKLSNQRLRLLLEIDKERPLASGGRFNPLVEIGLRYDGGTGESGIGAVLGLGGRYANATGLTVEGKFHTLVGRKDYKEWGIQGVIRQQSGANDQGLTFSLSPSYGATGNNANQVWEQELADGNKSNGDYQARLDVNMGYGLFTSGGLLTPYSELRMGDSNRYRLGLRWKPNSPFNLHLYGEHTTSNDSDRILLESHIRF